ADAARGDAEADPGEASGREGGEAGDAGKGGEGKEVGLTDSPPLPPAAAPRPATAAGEVSGASSAQDDWAAAFGRRSRRWVRSPPGWECGAGRSAGGTPSPCPRPAGRGSPGRWRPAISPAPDRCGWTPPAGCPPAPGRAGAGSARGAGCDGSPRAGGASGWSPGRGSTGCPGTSAAPRLRDRDGWRAEGDGEGDRGAGSPPRALSLQRLPAPGAGRRPLPGCRR